MTRSEPPPSPRWLLFAATGLALASAAIAQDAGTSAAGTIVGSPAIDFSTGATGPTESQIYVWVDASGVTHFTDRPDDYLARFRDQFRPVSLFVLPSGQPKR